MAVNDSVTQNLLPVQAYFNLDGTFNTFIGQNKPFYATSNPIQSGLTITNSTLDSSPIGSSSPSTGVFTNIATTTGTISTNASNATDIVNFLTLQSYAAGISWKNPVTAATLNSNITLSGLQTVDGVSLVAGNTVLVKNQSNSAQNGIYTVSSGAWTYATGCTTWAQYVSALVFVEYGSQQGSAWYCTAQPGGTLGTTAMNWSNFSVSSTYTAGTGLTLTGYQFSITPVGTAGTYGSASTVPVFTTNASGQVTSVTNTSIAISGSQVSGNISGNAANVTGIVAVANGGTGASSLTGYLYGNGTGAVTASTSIPTTALSGTVTNAQLANSSITINGSSISLGGSATITAAAPNALTIGTGLSGTSYNGSSAVTIAIDSTVATLTGIQTLTNKTISGSSNTLSNIGNSSLTNSSITFGSTLQALGSTVSALNGVSIGATTRSSGDFTTLSGNTVTSTTPVLSFNASNTIASFGSTTSGSYNQLVIQNQSNTANASANYVVSNNLGTDSSYYAEMGMNSSTFSSSTPADFYSINNGVYFSGHDGDISVGSGNGYKLYFAWGGAASGTAGGANAHVINVNGAIGLSTNLGTTPATSGTTGFGTSGQVLTSQGSSAAPTWTTITSGLTITDNTSSGSTYYPTMETATSGTATSLYTSSSKFSFVPSTGTLSATVFSGAGTGLTGTASSLSIGGTATTATTANALNTSNNYQVNSLGVGTAGSGTAGEIRATNNITAYYSDERLKTKVGDIENALDKVRQIETMMYHANETAVALGYDASIIEVGVTAQSVEKVMPQTVAPAPIDDKYLTVRYERLVPLLIEAIKELEAKVESLKNPKTGS